MVKLDKSGGFAKATDNCWTRFVTDLSGTWARSSSFRAEDGEREIDVPATFSPRNYWTLLKPIHLGVTFYTIYLGFGSDPRAFYFAYLTNWALVFSALYMILSILNSVFPILQPPPGQTVISRRGKITWMMFEIAANLGVLVTVNYWLLVFDGDLTVQGVLGHGVVAFLVLVDGLGVNTIPIRLRHYLEFVLPVASLYLLWSYLQSALNIGNPDNQDEDAETNDDLIYDALDWKGNPGETAVLGVLILFVLSPVAHFLLWTISSYRRRYVEEAEGGAQESSTYVEMSTV
jgi:hypothetical protein